MAIIQEPRPRYGVSVPTPRDPLPIPSWRDFEPMEDTTSADDPVPLEQLELDLRPRSNQRRSA